MQRDFSSTNETNPVFFPREPGQSQPSPLPPHAHMEMGQASQRQSKPTKGHHSSLHSQNQKTRSRKGSLMMFSRRKWKVNGSQVPAPASSEAVDACLTCMVEGGAGLAAPVPQLCLHFHSGLGPPRLCRACSVRCTTSLHCSSEIWLAQAGMPRLGSFTLAIVLFTSSTCSASMGMELRLL